MHSGSKSPFLHFDAILYLNLAIRADRRHSIEQELDRFLVPSSQRVRIESCYDPLNGVRGCVFTHIQAINWALEKGCKNVLILEDDCQFTEDLEKVDSYVQTFFDHFQNNWDVFFLGTWIDTAGKTDHPDYVKVFLSLQSHAYAINGPYLKTLRNHFQETYESVKDDAIYSESLPKSLDRQWVKLQVKDRWYSGLYRIAKQCCSYSDIEHKIVQRKG